MLKLLLLLALVALLVVLTLLAFAMAAPVVASLFRRLFRDPHRKGGAPTGAVGAFMEFDRIVRPSVEHVIETQEAARLPKGDHTAN